MQFKNRSEAVLYLWDYFHCANVPVPGDELPWRKIDRAMRRAIESQPYLEGPRPTDIRVREGRRVRNALRLALRTIASLSAQPEPWVVIELAELETATADLVAALSNTEPPVLH